MALRLKTEVVVDTKENPELHSLPFSSSGVTELMRPTEGQVTLERTCPCPMRYEVGWRGLGSSGATPALLLAYWAVGDRRSDPRCVSLRPCSGSESSHTYAGQSVVHLRRRWRFSSPRHGCTVSTGVSCFTGFAEVVCLLTKVSHIWVACLPLESPHIQPYKR